MKDLRNNMYTRSIIETVADISYIAGESKYFTGDSRYDVSSFIVWAKEFDRNYKSTNWHEVDYILTVTEFTLQKITNNNGYLHT